MFFFTSFSTTGENSKESLILSFKYFRGKLLDFGMDLAIVGLIVNNLLNLSAMYFGFVISFFSSLNNLGNLDCVPLLITVFGIRHDVFKSDYVLLINHDNAYTPHFLKVWSRYFYKIYNYIIYEFLYVTV